MRRNSCLAWIFLSMILILTTATARTFGQTPTASPSLAYPSVSYPPEPGTIPVPEKSELDTYTYAGMNSFCGDDIIALIFCQPLVDYSRAKAQSICDAFRAGKIPDFNMSINAGPMGIGIGDLKWYCNSFYPTP
jgi:hypothetical protein